ncbi:MAG: hypothetical protein IT561_14615 [Alphaproteobacteria bacterium]|nr:hypothetical protein [Alphaproteobacteria bacterium]
MIRLLLTTVVPLLAPLVIYGGWLLLARRRQRRAESGRPSLLAAIPWTPLLVAGFLLAAGAMIGSGLLVGTAPWADYEPARWRDGAIVPGGPR